jgi:hypothetical protein
MSMIAINGGIDKEAAINYAKLCGGEYEGHITISPSVMSGSVLTYDEKYENEVAMKLLLVMFSTEIRNEPITLVVTKDEIKSTLLLKMKIDDKFIGLVQKKLTTKTDAYEKIVSIYDGMKNCGTIRSIKGEDETAVNKKKSYVKYFSDEEVQNKFNEAITMDELDELSDWYGRYYADRLKSVSVLEAI